jgi:hypothetical protein
VSPISTGQIRVPSAKSARSVAPRSSNFPLPAADHHGCHRSTRVRSVSIRRIRAIRGPPFKQLPIAGRGSSRVSPINTGQIRVPSVESARSVAPRSSNFPLPAADHHGCHRSTRVRSVSHPPNPRDPWPPVQATSHCRPRIITDVPDQHGSDLCLIRQIRAIRGPPFKQLPIAGRGSSRMSPINTGQIRVSSAKSARSVAPRSSNFPLPAADHHGCHRSARVRSVFHPPNPRDPWPPVQATSHCRPRIITDVPDQHGSDPCSIRRIRAIRGPAIQATSHCRPRIITDVTDQHGSDPCLIRQIRAIRGPAIQATSHCRPRIITDVPDQHGSDPCSIRQIRAIRGPPFKQLPIAGRGSSRMSPISTGQIGVSSAKSARSVALPLTTANPRQPVCRHIAHRIHANHFTSDASIPSPIRSVMR